MCLLGRRDVPLYKLYWALKDGTFQECIPDRMQNLEYTCQDGTLVSYGGDGPIILEDTYVPHYTSIFLLIFPNKAIFQSWVD